MARAGLDDPSLRRAILDSLYKAYLEEGLYRGVVSKKKLGKALGAAGVQLERNLEYLLERDLIRMHKIEDLISITTTGIDFLEKTTGQPGQDELQAWLARIEKLLADILAALRR
ncbi:MAG TPA: hypothetical protein VJ417_12355 [Candidatus Glassbacteria bacterium]|nr:hypothetical protein [Candidatus Glassbacteria bacterium]